MLLEVQYNPDDTFLHRIVQYCEEVHKQYNVEPLVLVFVINKTRDKVLRKARKDPKHPYLLKLPTPLCPMVVLGAFFTAQEISLAQHQQRHDSIIKQLYRLSQQIFEHVVTPEESTIDDLLHVCDNASLKFEEGINVLEDLPDSNLKKRAYKCKYMPCPSPSPSPSPPISPSSPSAAQNWIFVERYLQRLGSEPMNWDACLVEGQQQGYLKSYTKSTSLKAAYLRWKKKNIK
ncbi:hypothetical protein AB4K20DRAFT_1970900 [Rhizopus microsporus]